MDYIDRFSYIEPSLHVRDEPYLFMVNVFKYFRIEFANISSSFCISVLHGDFFIVASCGLGINVTVA